MIERTRENGLRLQRVLADAGVAARRACEQLIESGHVQVNGQTVTRLPVFVDPGADRIVVDGRVVSPGGGRGGDKPALSRKLYILLHKPARVLCTTSDPGGRTTVLDLVDHPGQARLFPVGRLDYHEVGLVLLTNDGELAHRLTHARFGVSKTYLGIAKGRLDDRFIADLSTGVQQKIARAARTQGVRAGKITIEPAGAVPGDEERSVDKTRLRISVQGPTVRPIDELLGEAGVKLSKLVLAALGPLVLKGVASAAWRELEKAEVVMLKKAVGLVGGPGGDAKTRERAIAGVARRVAPRPATRPARKPRRTGRPGAGGPGRA